MQIFQSAVFNLYYYKRQDGFTYDYIHFTISRPHPKADSRENAHPFVKAISPCSSLGNLSTARRPPRKEMTEHCGSHLYPRNKYICPHIPWRRDMS